MTQSAIDPSTGDTLEEYEELDEAAVEARLALAAEARHQWAAVPIEQRCVHLREAAEVLRRRKDPLAERMAKEMGKPLAQGRAEIDKCAWVCEYYADEAAGSLADERIDSDGRRSYVAFKPLGVVLAIMPWNFPFWQVFRFAAPTLTAGNVALLKHAPNVPGCALAVERVFLEAGFPSNVFQALLVDVETTGRIIDDPRVAAVTLTGSTRAGRAVAERAGRNLKPTVLELGGSDPYVVLADADVEAAAETCVASRLINGGQSCIAAKRFIVVEEHRKTFETKVVELMGNATVGPPRDDGTTVGPMARADLRQNLHRQIEDSVEAGARLLLGGEVPDGAGFFYPPTVLTDVAPGMPAHDEELFGPVAAIVVADDDDDALRIANDTNYGLGAAVFTRDATRGEQIARDRLQAGACFVNAFVKSDPRLPFGGIKNSGYGRELGSFGIRSFVNVKTVYVR